MGIKKETSSQQIQVINDLYPPRPLIGFHVFSCKKLPRLCRVSPGFEPAFAGGSLPRNAALAQAYRVISN